ncbi:hypothetical protein LguiB_021437 [Lonicera macranthoides]
MVTPLHGHEEKLENSAKVKEAIRKKVEVGRHESLDNMVTFAKLENALKRAVALINVGQAEALEDALDFDDLEANSKPKDLMLSYISSDKGNDWSDRDLVPMVQIIGEDIQNSS